MESANVNRRAFLQAVAAVGAAALASGPAFRVLGKDAPAAGKKSIYVCSVCGHIEFGAAPEFCPVCHAPKEKFQQNDSVFAEAEAKGKDLTTGHTPVVTAKKQSALITDAPCNEITVRIGKKLHPMEEAHHIRFIDCYIDDKYVSRMMLTLGTDPAACFFVKAGGTKARIVELCNLHGYWQVEAEIV